MEIFFVLNFNKIKSHLDGDHGVVTGMVSFPTLRRLKLISASQACNQQNKTEFIYYDDFFALQIYLDNISWLFY